MKRIAFPLTVENGRLATVSGVEAAKQALLALLQTRQGEMPLSRLYGTNIDYNVTRETALLYVNTIIEAIGRYHPEIRIREIQPVFSGDGTFMDWTVVVDVEED